MVRHLAALIAACAVCLAVPAASQPPVTTASLFRDLYDLESLPLVKDGKCRQFSSYDRTGGNEDFGNYLSWDRGKDGKGTAVLADMQGPGAIVRIWSAHPDGVLKIFLDGQSVPVIDMPFDKLFTDPAFQPVRTTSSGGWISYWPIPYAKSCKVVVENTPGFHYQVTYQTYVPGREVETYTKDLAPAAKSELESALKAWRDPARNYTPAPECLLGTSPKAAHFTRSLIVASGEKETVFSQDGPACIDALRIRVPTGTTPLALKRIVIRAYWDRERTPSIEAPLADFFGCGFGEKSFVSLPLVMQPGDYTCRFPMPFARSAKIEIVNGTGELLPLDVDADYRTFSSLNSGAAYFHAKWNRELTVEGIPYTILLAKGRGHYVGCNMSMHGQRWLSFLEGDELIYSDGEKVFNGTGTEDYFNCGWYFNTGPVAMPLHGLTLQNWEWNQIAAYRLQVPDAVPFDKELAVKIEHGGENDYSDADYSSVAYFYQKEPHLDFFRLPEASKINLPRPAALPVPYALEAENLHPKASGGTLRNLKWEDIASKICGTGVPTLEPTRDGASLSFTVPVAFRDCYQILGYMAAGRDYGRVSCSVDGAPAATPVDLFAKSDTAPSKPVELAEVILDPGEHKVTLNVAGNNDDGCLPKISVDKLLLVSMSPWIRDWQIVGPFEDNLDRPFPPETQGFVAGASYDGRGGKVSWQRASANRNGFVPVAEPLKCKDGARAYAFTRVISPDDRETELLLASVDNVKAWLNGKVIWRKEAWRGPQQDQDRVKVRLRRGENTLLVKIRIAEKWGMYARFRDPSGELRYNAAP